MRSQRIGILLLFLAPLWLLSRHLQLDPLRTALALMLIYGGSWLIRRDRGPAPAGHPWALVGVLHLIDRDFLAHDIALTCGVADVKIDLSRAIIPPGEHQIRIRGFVGDVSIYLPYDLEVSVVGWVPLGALRLMGEGNRRRFASSGYADAASKVKIDVALAVGDIDVRYL